MIRATGHGNVVSDIELKHTPSGKAVRTVRVAVYNGKDKKWFVDLEAWEGLAENLAATLHKGDRVVFAGILREDEWTNKEGETRRKTKVSLDEAGASLSYAQAEVTKLEYGGGDDGGRQRSERNAEVVDEARAVRQTAGVVEEAF